MEDRECDQCNKEQSEYFVIGVELSRITERETFNMYRSIKNYSVSQPGKFQKPIQLGPFDRDRVYALTFERTRPSVNAMTLVEIETAIRIYFSGIYISKRGDKIKKEKEIDNETKPISTKFVPILKAISGVKRVFPPKEQRPLLPAKRQKVVENKITLQASESEQLKTVLDSIKKSIDFQAWVPLKKRKLAGEEEVAAMLLLGLTANQS